MNIKDWATNNVETIKQGAIVVGTVGAVAVIAPTVLSISMKLITTGAMLGFGFWISRQATNALDVWLAKHNKYLIKEIQDELISQQQGISPA